MYCGNCGNVIEDDNNFCENCGSPTKPNGSENTQTPKQGKGELYKFIAIAIVVSVFLVFIYKQVISNRESALNGIWTFGEAFVEFDNEKLRVHKRSDDFKSYAIKVSRKQGRYYIEGWTEKNSSIEVRKDIEGKGQYLLCSYWDQDSEKYTEITMERATLNDLDKLTKRVDNSANSFISENGRDAEDYIFESSFIENGKVYHIYLDKDDKNVGLIMDNQSNCYAYNIYRYAGRLEKQEYFGYDEELASPYVINKSDYIYAASDYWQRYYNLNYGFSVDFPYRTDFTIRYLWYDEYFQEGDGERVYAEYFDESYSIYITVKATAFDYEFWGSPFDKSLIQSSAGGSSILGKLNIKGADEAYLILLSDLEMHSPAAYIYKDGIEYELSITIYDNYGDGNYVYISDHYDRYLYYMINSFAFEENDDIDSNLDKYEKEAAKYLSSIYGEDIRNYYQNDLFYIDGKRYYEFINHFNIKMGVIVDQDLKCYDLLAYRFGNILEEIKDY